MRALDTLTSTLLRRRVRGAGRLAAFLQGSRTIRSVPASLNGLRWEADPLDWMDEQVIRYGAWEPEITDCLVSLLPMHGCLWDVGANAGVHTLSVRARRPDVTVYAFEPSPTEFARLSRNAAINHLHVTAYCVALSDTRGYRNLSVSDSGTSGNNSLMPLPELTYSRAIPVWCDTGNDLMTAGVRCPDVVKIDVEGNEPAVLRGMSQPLSSPQLRHIVFEAPDEDSAAGLALREAGFELTPLPGGNWLASR